MTVAQSFNTAGNMLQSGLDQNYGQMVGQGFAGTGQIMQDNGVNAGTQVLNMANPMQSATSNFIDGNYGNGIAATAMGAGAAIPDQAIG